MKAYLLFLFLYLAFFCTNCKCEGVFTTYTRVVNLSTTDIVIKGYRDGVVDTNMIIVRNGSVAQVGLASGRSRGVVFSPNFIISDSVVVEFDGKRKSIHYGRRNGNNPTAIGFSNIRNLINETNYTSKTIAEDKCYLKTEFIYTFTEADYLNAK